MKRFFSLLIILFLTHAIKGQSFQRTSENNVLKEKEFIQVYVNKKGTIFKNNQQISINELKVSLMSLKQKKGIVHLSVANTTKKSGFKKQNKVIQLISYYKIPFKPYTDKYFRTELIW